MESDSFYDLNNHGVSKAPTNFLGCVSYGDTKTFFPLVRKHGMNVLPPEAQTSAIVQKSKPMKGNICLLGKVNFQGRK